MAADSVLAGLAGKVLHDEIVPARAPWDYPVKKGETLRIVDLEGNQAVDFLVYNLHDDAERYSLQDTIAAQGNIFLKTGVGTLFQRRPADDDHHGHQCGLSRHDRRRLFV
jgi:uncharacterized protein YcgI (DUF1989 family)